MRAVLDSSVASKWTLLAEHHLAGPQAIRPCRARTRWCSARSVIKWVLPEPGTPQAVRLRNDFRRGLHDLLAPDIFSVEVAHALTRAERRGVLPPPLSIRRLAAVLRFPPRFHPYLPLLPRAAAISSTTRHGVYDCLHVALAEREGIPLVTADQRLLNNLGPSFPFLVDLASLP